MPSSRSGAPVAPAGWLQRDIARLVWALVPRIPTGRVATYGDVATVLGLPRHARHVGRALRGCPARLGLPWHRVVAAGGRIALPGERGLEQRRRLESEGVPFRGAKVDLDRCRWRG